MSEPEADPLEPAFLEAAVRALRRRVEALRKLAAPGVTTLDGYNPIVLVTTSESAHAIKRATALDRVADDLEAEGAPPS